MQAPGVRLGQYLENLLDHRHQTRQVGGLEVIDAVTIVSAPRLTRRGRVARFLDFLVCFQRDILAVSTLPWVRGVWPDTEFRRTWGSVMQLPFKFEPDPKVHSKDTAFLPTLVMGTGV